MELTREDISRYKEVRRELWKRAEVIVSSETGLLSKDFAVLDCNVMRIAHGGDWELVVSYIKRDGGKESEAFLFIPIAKLLGKGE